MSLSGNVDALASRIADEFNAVRSEIASGGGGSLGGFLDCSAMTTAAAINAATDGLPVGTTVWLGPRPSGSDLVVNETIVIRTGHRILGAGGRSLATRLAAGPSLPSGDPMMAAEAWINNGTVADEPVWVEGLDFDLLDHDAPGLVVYHFWSTFYDLQFHGGTGDAQLFVADRSKNDTATTNSHSENRFAACRFNESSVGTDGMYVQCSTNIANQDGHIQDSFFSGIGGTGLHLERGAGWTIENNHFYGIGNDAIMCQRAYGTRVMNNYVEDFGVNDAGGGWYYGICMDIVLDGRASIVSGNSVSTLQPDDPAAGHFGCFSARAGYDQKLASLVVTGNSAVFGSTGTYGPGGPVDKKSQAYEFGDDGDLPTGAGGRMLWVEFGLNQMDTPHLTWWQETLRVSDATVTLNPGSPASMVNTDDDPGRTIFVGTTAPTSPAVGDVWIFPAT